MAPAWLQGQCLTHPTANSFSQGQSLYVAHSSPVQEVVENHGSRKRYRQCVEHALKARVRDKEAEDVGAKAYAKVHEDEEGRGGLGKARGGDHGEGDSLAYGLEVAVAKAYKHACQKQHGRGIRVCQKKQANAREDKEGIDDNVLPVAVHGGARNGAAYESSHSVDEEEVLRYYGFC